MQFFQSIGYIVPDAVGIGYRRILSDPYAAVNAPAQVFREMSVDVFVDGTE